MKKAFLIIIAMFTLNNTHAQTNLVPNGDFEIYSSLPTQWGEIDKAIGWNNVNGSTNSATYPYGSPDYFYIPINNNFIAFGPIIPISGNGQAGLSTYDNYLPFGNYREYISSKLSTTMTSGNKYKVSFYLTNGVDTTMSLASNNFGIHFSTNPLYQDTCEPINVIPQIEIDSIIYFWNYWQYFSFKYTADSSYNYITLGNFRDDAHTLASLTGKKVAYYFIDKIEIYPLLPVIGELAICKAQTDTLRMYGDSIVSWSDSLNPNVIIATDSMIIVTPTVTTTYKATTNYDTAYFTVHVFSPPTINLGNDTTLCLGSGQTLQLNVPALPYVYYQWQDGSSGLAINVNQAGTYWVKASVNNSCFKSDTINVVYSANPVISFGNDTTLCTGDTLTLNATYPNATYQWQDGSTSPIYYATQQGMYWVKITDQNNCFASYLSEQMDNFDIGCYTGYIISIIPN